ncbi:Ppx/GppA phosphatase family protein [Ferrimonas pelagia]|uniref:Exopolyphosphatase n=1 Tax=Ferrimonas pelagia TaxID=1177826 RepID=A0ABP9F3S2_9GAMM
MAGARAATVNSARTQRGGPLLAAITLGSNSFNMLLARPGQPLPQVIAKHKRKVRLAQGLLPDAPLAPEAAAAGRDCLRWFGQLLAQYQPKHVAVYATAALRQASDGAAFCAQAEPLLGYPIQIISGDSEAAYIYQGMRATTDVAGSALVLDIGGASTELVIGDEHIRFKHSLALGAVLYTQEYFAGAITAQGFVQAHQAVARALDPLRVEMEGHDWQTALGISGTFRSLFELADNRGLALTRLTPAFLAEIQQELIGCGHAQLDGLVEERVPTFAAGVAILAALMAELGIAELHPAGGALREGVLVELDQCARRSQSLS